MTKTAPEVDLRGLDLFERVAARPGNVRFRNRLLKGESPQVLERLAKLELAHAARAAMATQVPGGTGAALAEPPARIGPFGLVERIGYGGMGDVWRGERDDGRFEQVVAIKLIHAHLTGSAAQAFEAERRILAKLDHPDIVRLTDGGETEAGLPYLIMDYVKGAPLDEAVAPLPLSQRIVVFRQAASVVQFAHSRLVAHADLKPSNILVDSEGRVRLLDFGIAGLLSGEGEPSPSVGAMTGGFASPQRLAGAAPSIADDVYALGMTLSLIIGEIGDVDLTAVVAKATAREEADRYGTVGDLIADLDRWSGGYPVTARKVGARDRAAKFFGRNKLSVTASLVAILALVSATAVATLSSVQARKDRAEATARFNEVRSLATYMLYDQYDALENTAGTLKLRAELVNKSQIYLEKLARNKTPSPDLALDIGEGFSRLAQISRGRFGSGTQGTLARVERNLASGDAVLSDAIKTHPSAEKLRIALARIRSKRCEKGIYSDQAFPKALAFADSAEALLTNTSTPDANNARWSVRNCRADVLVWMGDSKSAIAILLGERSAAAARFARRTPADDELFLLGLTSRLLAEAAYYANDPAGSVEYATQATLPLKELVRRHPKNVRFLDGYAASLLIKGEALMLEAKHYDRAVEVLAEGSSIYRRIIAGDPDDKSSLRALLSLEGDHAGALAMHGQVNQALALLDDIDRQYAAIVAKSPNEGNLVRQQARAMLPRPEILAMAGRKSEYCTALRRSVQAWRSFDKRFGASPSDKTDVIDKITKKLEACPT